MSNQIEKHVGILPQAGVEGLLLTSPVSRFYAAGYEIEEGVALITAQGSWYFTDSRFLEAAERHLEGFQLVQSNHAHPYEQLIQQVLDATGIKTLGMEEDRLTLGTYQTYQEKLQAELKPCQKSLSSLRYSKQPWELDRMRQAQAITDRTFAEILSMIHPGMTEKELCAELIYRLYKYGADGLAFDPIVVAGPNSSLPHGVPGDRVLQTGDFVTMDFGAKYNGYCSDMTRTVALGHATDEMRQVYDTVLRAQAAGMAASKAGVVGRTIHEAAAKVIADAGYGAYFGHGYGHSLGIEVHEDPGCNLRGTEPIPAGAVCSAEPGIYLPGKFGVRIEDAVIFTDSGVEDLTKSPKELLIV